MKNLIFFFLIMITTSGFAQVIKIDTISIVKPEAENEIIDSAVFKNLEEFYDKNDAIVYIYRLKSFVGAAAKWGVMVDDILIANLKQKEYVVAHIDTKEKCHYFSFPNMIFNYTNFKPNTYYYIMLKGFDMETGYFNEKALSEFETCVITSTLKK